jgi:anti-sigma-K factor RskA
MSADEPHIDPEGCAANAAPYVLGALTDEEHDAFRRHIESCAVCREEVAALALVASALPAAAPQLSAPPELKRRVMSSVHDDARRRAAELADGRGAAERAGAPERTARAWLRWRPNLAAAALAAAVIALAVVVLSQGGGGGGGTRVIRAEAPAGANVSLWVSGGHAQLDISRMPQTPSQRVYEVWIKRSGAPQPTDALFTVTTQGDATVGVPGSIDGVKLIMVTSEPLGGTRVPTTSPVIVAHVS